MYTTYEPREIQEMQIAANQIKNEAPPATQEDKILAAIRQIGFFSEISLDVARQMLSDIRLTTHKKDEIVPADRYDGRLCVIMSGAVMMGLENDAAIELETGHLFGDVGYFLGGGYAKELNVTRDDTKLFSFKLRGDAPPAALAKCMSGMCASMAEKLSWYGFA